MWNSNTVVVLASFRGKGFLGTKVIWKDIIYYISNIYSPCSFTLMNDLLKDLLEVKRKFSDGEWIFGGDFNAVKKRNERFGGSVACNTVEMRKFSIFIEDSGLVVVPCKGKKLFKFNNEWFAHKDFISFVERE